MEEKTFEIISDINKIIKGTIYIKTLGGKIAFKATIITAAHKNCDNTKEVSLFPFKIAYPVKQKTKIARGELLKNILSLSSIKKFGMSSGKFPYTLMFPDLDALKIL